MFPKQESGPMFLALVLVIVGIVIFPQFHTAFNINSVISSATPIVLLAIGMTFVLIGGEIDLSVGSTMSLASVMLATLMNGKNGNIVPTMVATMAVCACVGLVNGILITIIGIPSFITTLAMLFILDGVNLVWTNGSPPSGLAPAFVNLALAGTGLLSTGLIIIIAAMALFSVLLSRTVTGRSLYLIGSNARSAKNCGIPVKSVTLRSFMTSSVCAGLAGIYATSYTGSGETFLGSGLELTAIAAAVIGGVSLFGGKGTAVKATMGALILALIFDLLLLGGASSELQPIVTGIVLLTGVVLYSRHIMQANWVKALSKKLIRKSRQLEYVMPVTGASTGMTPPSGTDNISNELENASTLTGSQKIDPPLV